MDHQNMSEHVLCMVLYLIELGLDNQVQDCKEDEVLISFICTSSPKRYPQSLLLLYFYCSSYGCRFVLFSLQFLLLCFLYLLNEGALHRGALP